LVDYQSFLLIIGNTLLVVMLAAAIAFHPEIARKRSSLSDLELPKTMIIYAVIGMMVGYLVGIDEKIGQVIGFTIFGLGGLMRFRTEIGSAKETGWLIFVTLGGLCIGLNLYVVAICSFGLIWLLIFFTERKNVYQIIVRFEEMENATNSTKIYREFIKSNGWDLVSESRGGLKPQIEFVFQADRTVNREIVIKAIASEISSDVRGTIQLDIQ
jgi:hypothetical protein